MTFGDRLATLDTLWSAWAECGRAMADEQWELPTRLGDWDVRSLYAHAASWPSTLPSLVDRVSDAEPAVLRLDEVVSIGILEATVHLLDLQRALDRPRNAPAGGLAHTVALLAAMAPPVDFIEAATGRGTAAPLPVLA